MKIRKLEVFFVINLVVCGFVFSAPAFADGCFDPPGEPDTFVTQYGGADLSCPSAEFTECTVTFKNGLIESESPGCTDLAIVTDIDPVTGGVTWESFSEPADWVDAALTDSAQGGKGCLYSYGTDKNMGILGYSTSPTDFFPPTKAVFCSDGIREASVVVQPEPVVKNCILEAGQQKEIYGVTFSCDAVGANQTRTIIVVQDTTCDEFGGNCTGVPAFGFTDGAGNIDFNNVCRCVGDSANSGGLPPIPACEPDPENINGGCEVIDAEVPVDISIQNPKCFTVGGTRRCY